MVTTLVLEERDTEFLQFLQELRAKSPVAWSKLVPKLRKRIVPMLHGKILGYPPNALQTKSQFVEEVFEEILLKFAEFLDKGTYTRYSDLEAMAVTISGYKLKEGFARLKKEQRLQLMEDDDLNRVAETYLHERQTEDYTQEAIIIQARAALATLSTIDQEILTRYFEGEELNKIADDNNMSHEACRKRKQRALEALKKAFGKTLMVQIAVVMSFYLYYV